MVGTLDASMSPRCLVLLGMEVIEMDVLGCIFSTGSAGGWAVTSVLDIVPTGL